MKHLNWDYKGYNDLNLKFETKSMQSDWNATILTKLNQAFGEEFENGYCVFISENYIDILESIGGYNNKNMTIFNKKIIPLEINTPKIYVTESHIDSFMLLKHYNYGSVTIKNYN